MKLCAGLLNIFVLVALLGHSVWRQSEGRFVWDKEGNYVLDTKTGQACVPFEAARDDSNNGSTVAKTRVRKSLDPARRNTQRSKIAKTGATAS
jgi:hypothetical protein